MSVAHSRHIPDARIANITATASVTAATAGPEAGGAPSGTSPSPSAAITMTVTSYQHERRPGDNGCDDAPEPREPLRNRELDQRRHHGEGREQRQSTQRHCQYGDRYEVGAGAGHEHVSGAQPSHPRGLQGGARSVDRQGGKRRPAQVGVVLPRPHRDNGGVQQAGGQDEHHALQSHRGGHEWGTVLVRLVPDAFT